MFIDANDKPKKKLLLKPLYISGVIYLWTYIHYELFSTLFQNFCLYLYRAKYIWSSVAFSTELNSPTKNKYSKVYNLKLVFIEANDKPKKKLLLKPIHISGVIYLRTYIHYELFSTLFQNFCLYL